MKKLHFQEKLFVTIPVKLQLSVIIIYERKMRFHYVNSLNSPFYIYRTTGLQEVCDKICKTSYNSQSES